MVPVIRAPRDRAMTVSIKEFRIDPALGEVFVELRAKGAHPIEATLSTFARQLVVNDEKAEPDIVRFRLPAAEGRYMLFGIVTPAAKVMFAPTYERRLLQGHTILRGTGSNPQIISTRKVSGGEWVGAPEIIRLRLI